MLKRPIGMARGILSGRSPMLAVAQSVGAEFVVLALNLLTGLVTARLLGPEGRGVFAAVTLWQQLIASVGVAGLQTAVIYHSRRPGLDRGDVAGVAAVAAMVSTSALALLAALIIPPMMADYPAWAVTATLLCLGVAHFNALHMIMKQSFAAAGAYRLFNFASVLSPLLFLVLLGVGAARGLTPAVAVAGLALTAAVALLWLLPAWWRVVRPRLGRLRETWAAMRGYTARAAGSDAVNALSGYVDRLVLIPLVAGEALGLYVVAFSFSRLLLALRPAVDAVVFPSMADRAPAEMKRLHDRAFRVALAAMVGAVVALLVVDEILLTLLYGEAFAAAAPLFRVLALEAALTLLGGITMRYLLARGLPSLVSGVQLGGLVLSTALVLGLVPRFGVEGAAWAVAAAAAVKLAALMGLLGVLGHGVPWPLMGSADLRFILERLR